MKKSKRKKVDDVDDEWIPKQSSKFNISNNECIIHCTDSCENLTEPKDFDSWKVILDAAKVRQFKPILEIHLEDNEIPPIKYHQKCRKSFTHKRKLEDIKEKQKILENENDRGTNEMRPFTRQNSGQCSSSQTTILPRKCIFCGKDKYIKGTKTREKLSNCMEIRADSKIRELAIERNDLEIIKVASDELIAKEACYHKTCYKDYTRPQYEKRQVLEIDNEHVDVFKSLSDLYNNPRIVNFKCFQDMVESVSHKKNLKRKIESKTDNFCFIDNGNGKLIYPKSIKIDDIISDYQRMKVIINKYESMTADEEAIVKCANTIKEQIKGFSYQMSWPPVLTELDMTKFKLPSFLDLFMKTLLSPSNTTTSRAERLKSSLGQDLVYAVNNGRLLTPKSILFASQIKELTNNYELLTTANKLGHSISYTSLQEILTEVAYKSSENVKENEVPLPENCSNQVFTILVEDNIDRLEETLSGHGTTHKVNSIVIQPSDIAFTSVSSGSIVSPPMRTKRRSFRVNQLPLQNYVKRKRQEPQKIVEVNAGIAKDLLFADQNTIYTMWLLLRMPDYYSIYHNVPSWTGFQIKLRENTPISKTNIGYLDCLDAPASDISTIYFMMERAIKIKDQLDLPNIVCVYDQAIYAKAFQIKCNELHKFKDVFLMMGTFHVILTFLQVIAARFKDSGLKDVLIQSMVVAEGSVDSMLTGTRAYKRAVRVYKILYEAISRLLLKEFDLQHPGTTKTMHDFIEQFDMENLNNALESNDLQEFCSTLDVFKDKICETSLMSKFWISFLDMIEILLNIIFATRSGQWDLYLEAIGSSLAWFFAYDRTNYSRYLTAHYYELLSLPDLFPNIYTEFIKGHFSVQLSDNNPFGRMEADKVIECTINKDTKTPGGTCGFSTNHSAVQRWTFTAAYRAGARKSLQEFLHHKTHSTHSDLLPSRMKRDLSDTQKVQDTIADMFLNPFTETELLSISSGLKPTDKVTNDLVTAEEKGREAMTKFVSERLVNQTVGFYETLPKLKLETFSTMLKKKVTVKTNGKTVQFSSQSDIFGKIALIQQNRSIDLKEVFSYPLGPIPWSLATNTGEMVKTTKSSLMGELEKGLTNIETVPKPYAAIIDGMALVRKMNNNDLTFDEFADNLLLYAISSSPQACRIDIVFDVYRINSIKNAEREKRGSGNLQFTKIIGTHKIKQWGTFLSNSSNKGELIRFLANHWQQGNSIPGTLEVNVAFDQCCRAINHSNNIQLENLSCDHEEADTRILLHARDIADKNIKNIAILTPDTDVFLIALAASKHINAEVYICTGTQAKARIISISKVKDEVCLKYDLPDKNKMSEAMLALHGFTGCDSVSSFSGRGKIAPMKLMLKNDNYINLFSNIGKTAALSDVNRCLLEEFVCEMYGHKEISTNSVRYKLYQTRQGKIEAKTLPPCSDSLTSHSKRANYQIFIWRSCLQAYQNIPSPEGYGWSKDEEGNFDIEWGVLKPAPDEILELLYCTCRKNCAKGTCQCVDNKLSCTDACSCKTCDNVLEEYDDDENIYSSSEDEED